jgi:hypothetical protein
MQSMYRITCVVLVGGFATSALAADPVTFTKADLGKLPAGWTATQTGEGKGSSWKVVAEDSAPSQSGFALAQTAAGPSALFNLCVRDGDAPADLELAVKMKAIAGTLDQGGGLVWRYVDANNYYVARFNPLEDNFRVYKVVAGKRIQLGTKEDLKPAGPWVTVGIRMKGTEIECTLNGEKHLSVKDDTFAKPGKVGLWTKADAQSRFDQFTIRAVK